MNFSGQPCHETFPNINISWGDFVFCPSEEYWGNMKLQTNALTSFSYVEAYVTTCKNASSVMSVDNDTCQENEDVMDKIKYLKVYVASYYQVPSGNYEIGYEPSRVYSYFPTKTSVTQEFNTYVTVLIEPQSVYFRTNWFWNLLTHYHKTYFSIVSQSTEYSQSNTGFSDVSNDSLLAVYYGLVLT